MKGETFTKIDVTGGIDFVDVRVCDCTSVRVTTDANLQEFVETEIEDDTLKIDMHGWIEPTIPIRVTIRTPSLEEIDIRGATRGEVEGVDSPGFRAAVSGASSLTLRGEAPDSTFDVSGSSTLEVGSWRATDLDVTVSGASTALVTALATSQGRWEVSGASDVTVAGTGKDLDFEISGSSELNAQEFRVRDALVEVSGASNLSLCALGALDVEVSGASDVVYHCDPTQIQERVTGSSSVQRR